MTDLRENLQAALGPAYTLGRELGGGGMSRVFIAEDLALGRAVVVKVVSADLGGTVSIERFRQEIAVLAQLQHPHIVPVLAAGEAAALPFFIMPFVSGESLRSRLTRGGALPVRDTVSVLDDVAKALAYAHARGVVHRDIKPENIMLSGGAAVVTDFGIAKALASAQRGSIGTVSSGRESSPVLTTAGLAIGTPAYMAPEQAAADPATDGRADLYSLGIVAYEMLTGASPFADRSGRELLTAHMAEVPMPVGDRTPDVPPDLAALVQRLVAKNPVDRPPTAAAVVDQLATLPTPHQMSVPTPRSPATSDGVTLLAGWRRVWRWVAVAAAVAAAVGAGAIAVQHTAPRTPAADSHLVAVLPFRVGGADPSLQYLREGMLDLLAATLTGAGGFRATEPRAVLNAWRRAGGSTIADLSRGDAGRLARGLGAERIVMGSVVGAASRMVISAALVRASDGGALAEATVDGPADSLVPLVDRLTAQLLSLGAGEGELRLGNLTSTSLPALRAYLDGTAAIRAGRFGDAREMLGRALDLDSTFALAGLKLQLVAGWMGEDPVTRHGARVAWGRQEKLQPRDRAMLAAVMGPRYPGLTPIRERKASVDRYLSVARDAPEAWYLEGDAYYHSSGVLGVHDGSDSARIDFTRAVDLDSTYVEPMLHLYQLAVAAGDRSLTSRVDRLWSAADSMAPRLIASRWYAATVFGDSVRSRAFRSAIERDSLDPAIVLEITRIARETGVGVPDADRARAAQQRRPSYDGSLDVLLDDDLGHPREASRARGVQYRSAEVGAASDVVAWPFGGGDSALSTTALVTLERIVRGPPEPADTALIVRRFSFVALAAAHVARGDTADVAATRTAMRSSLPRSDSSDFSSIVVDAMAALALPAPMARVPMARLDTALRNLNGNDGQLTYMLGDFVLARYLAAHGDAAGALAAIRRRTTWNSPLLLATALREEGGLAAHASDRAGAVRAYEHYLALRYNPDRPLRAERDSVARLLAAVRNGGDRQPSP